MHYTWVSIRRVLVLAIAILASAQYPEASCTGPPALEAKVQSARSAEAYGQLGTWFHSQRQFACAAVAYNKALEIHPSSARLAYQLGLSLYSSGEVAQAIDALERSVQLDPKGLKAHQALAAAFDQVHRSSEAETEWRAALTIDPHSSEALDGLTGDLLADKDFRSVITLLHPATGSVQSTSQRTLALADAYSQMGMLEDASGTLRTALRSHPSSLPMAKALAGVLVLQARKEEAEDILETALKKHPKDTSLRLLYLRILVLNDEAVKAGRLGHELLAVAPRNWEVLYLNGVLEQRAGNFAAARDYLQQAVALNPNHVESRQSLGAVLAKLKDAPGAKEQLEKAIALGSRDPEIRFELAMVLRTLGETQGAEQQLKLYQQETQAKSDLTQAAAKAAFADQKLASGDLQESAILYREALTLAPTEASLAYKLAMALDKAGDFVNERAALEQAISIEPNMAEAHNQLGFLASRAGETTSAEEHFQRAVLAYPGFTKAWVNLAATFFLESKLPEAKEAVAHALQLEPGNPQAQRLSKALNETPAKQQR